MPSDGAALVTRVRRAAGGNEFHARCVGARPHFTVLIAPHGIFDLIPPYFTTQLLLDQIPASSGSDRVELEVYRGGHMFYMNDGVAEQRGGHAWGPLQ